MMITTRNLMIPQLATFAASLVLAGCSLSPTYERPNPPIPREWANSNSGVASDSQAEPAKSLAWDSFVIDDELRQLVAISLENNRDLRQAVLNVEAARSAYRIQRADRLPGVDALGSVTRQRVPGDMNEIGEATVQESYQVGLGITAFELDLFGRVRNLSQAALMEYLATEEAARSVQVSLIGELINAYVARNSAGQRRELTRRTLVARETSLDLIDRRRQSGASSALDLEDARGLTEQARADLERADREYRQAGNAIGLLAGVSDVSPYLSDSFVTGPFVIQELAPGAPSELIASRPDISAAELRLRARNADIGAARAAFFPRISLTGTFGSSSAEFSNLFESGQRAWSFMPQITVPIFSGGRNRANLELANVRRDIAVAAYEQNIQVAFREVSDALAATDTLRREERARRELAESSARALKLAEARYRAGVDGHLRYLDAQRTDFANQVALIEIVAQRQIAVTTLFRTLGGGWSATSEQATSR